MTSLPLGVRLIDAGLARHADAILSQATTCVELVAADVASAVGRTGASRLGGAPDVPEGFSWPTWRGEPLAFLGQLDLAELQALPACRDLPPSGLLSFFFDAGQQAWGYDPEHSGGLSIVWFRDESGPLAAAPFPDDVRPEARFQSAGLLASQSPSLPPWEAIGVESLGLSREEFEAYCELLDDSRAHREHQAKHQLLGHPWPVQDEMQLQCQLASNGVYCGDSSGSSDPRRRALEQGAAEWRLLLQLDSDESLGMEWGDAGRLFIWIRDPDLQARRFERAWAILQSG